ncbi:MAG: sigma-70 family RNA polymerase sigma factor [Gemmatimonadota bacterium]
MVRIFERYLHDIGRERLLAREEEAELARRSRGGDEAARCRLVSANLRFVVSVARRYRGRGLSLADLVNEGNLGLLRAAERYDETRGVRFITYASWWVRQSILQAIARSAGPRDRVGPLERLSLDEPIGGEAGATLADLVADDRDDPPERRMRRRALRYAVDASLTELPAREQLVLRLYFGLDGEPPLPLSEVGRRLGVTRERTRQIKERALARLRSGARRHGLHEHRSLPDSDPIFPS